MIKFIYKKRADSGASSKKEGIIIYYNFLDIILGIFLVALVAFFINDYLSHSFGKNKAVCDYVYGTANIEKGLNKPEKR